MIYFNYSPLLLIYFIILLKKNIKIKTLKIFDDYSQFYNMKYIYNSNIIYKPNTKYSFYKYIVITLSNPCDSKSRVIQRHYRLKYHRNILFVYVVGLNECKSLLYCEKEIYRDILYLNIKNHYFNITMLLLATINWINMNIKYDYLIKLDVDILTNIPLLFIFINTLKHKLHYSGYLYNKTRVCRDKTRICFVPYSIFNFSYLPSFVASGLLILSNFASYKLDEYHKIYNKYMIRDDQYIGVICDILSIRPHPINKYYKRVNSYNTSFNIRSFLSYHTSNIDELNKLYKLVYINF